MMTNARIDRNQPEVVKEFRRLGYSVKPIHQVKKCCDLLISKDKFTFLVEVKDGEKPPSARRLTEGEQEFKDSWQGRYYICISLEDVHKIARAESAIVKAAGLIIKEHVG